MRWLLLILALAVGAVGGALGAFYLVEKSKAADIVLAPKRFVDTETYVVVSGTMTGASVGNPNNSYTILCYNYRMECWIAAMRQNGPRTISSIDAPYDLGITQWSDSEITALADGALGCAKTTLTIARKTQEAFWLDEPVNLAEPQCKDADRQTRRYSIEDSPGRKKLHN